jgi:hypothetical protein
MLIEISRSLHPVIWNDLPALSFFYCVLTFINYLSALMQVAREIPTTTASSSLRDRSPRYVFSRGGSVSAQGLLHGGCGPFFIALVAL